MLCKTVDKALDGDLWFTGDPFLGAVHKLSEIQTTVIVLLRFHAKLPQRAFLNIAIHIKLNTCNYKIITNIIQQLMCLCTIFFEQERMQEYERHIFSS